MLYLTGGTLALPVRPTATAAEWTFPPPDADAPWETETIRASSHSRRAETDLTTGEVHLRIEDDFGMVRDAAHGLISGGIARETWTIHPEDPLSARGACHWTEEMERDGIRLRTETTCEMWSDATHFHLSARLLAYENDETVHDRAVTESLARDHL